MDDVYSLLESIWPGMSNFDNFLADPSLPWCGSPEYRRHAFMRSIREFWHAYDFVSAAYERGPHLVISLAYFVVFQLLFLLNQRRGGFLGPH